MSSLRSGIRPHCSLRSLGIGGNNKLYSRPLPHGPKLYCKVGLWFLLQLGGMGESCKSGIGSCVARVGREWVVSRFVSKAVVRYSPREDL